MSHRATEDRHPSLGLHACSSANRAGPARLSRGSHPVPLLAAPADAGLHRVLSGAESCFMSLAEAVCMCAAAHLREYCWVQATLALP